MKQFDFLFLGFCTVFEHVNETGSLDHEGLLIVNNLFAWVDWNNFNLYTSIQIWNWMMHWPQKFRDANALYTDWFKDNMIFVVVDLWKYWYYLLFSDVSLDEMGRLSIRKTHRCNFFVSDFYPLLHAHSYLVSHFCFLYVSPAHCTHSETLDGKAKVLPMTVVQN